MNHTDKLKFTKIIKRDGRIVKYNSKCIYKAIEKAWKATYDGQVDKETLVVLTNRVERNILRADLQYHSVEDIQTFIMDVLNFFDTTVAKNYMDYATKRKVARESTMDVTKQLRKLIDGDKEVINANANKDSRTFSTHRDLTAGQVAKPEGLKMLPIHVREAHIRGDIHYHDLDYSPYSTMTNCCLPDIKTMFDTGFEIGNAQVEKPKSIGTATAQIAQIIANVASSQYGGTSIDRIDELLEPYAEMNYKKYLKDVEEFSIPNGEYYAVEKTKKDIYNAIQSLEYEINTLYTSNGQTPFTTIGFGLAETWFGKEIQKAILQVRIDGLGASKRTAIFPKLLFTLKDGLNLKKADPHYDIKQLALKCSSERMYPDILNYDSIVRLTGSFKASMGCRSFLQGWKDENGNDVTAGRMNLGVVTLNLPRIALQSNGNFEEFWEIFENRIQTMHDALKFRKEVCFEALPENAPILYKHGAFSHKLKDGEKVAEKLFLNKRSTISLGYIGLYEVASVFYGSDWEQNPEAKTFTLDILKKMYAYCQQWGNEEGIHYSVYATPSESLTDRFAGLDKKKFGSVKDVTDKEYYTNSFHYDVRKQPTPFDKIAFEMDYPVYSSGGFIHYVEYPNVKHNLTALETVWDYAYDKIGYLGTNTPIDKCYKCEFEGEFKTTELGFECPECGNNNPNEADCVKRTCGYLGNPIVRPMIKGRRKEIASRAKHM